MACFFKCYKHTFTLTIRQSAHSILQMIRMKQVARLKHSMQKRYLVKTHIQYQHNQDTQTYCISQSTNYQQHKTALAYGVCVFVCVCGSPSVSVYIRKEHTLCVKIQVQVLCLALLISSNSQAQCVGSQMLLAFFWLPERRTAAFSNASSWLILLLSIIVSNSQHQLSSTASIACLHYSL